MRNFISQYLLYFKIGAIAIILLITYMKGRSDASKSIELQTLQATAIAQKTADAIQHAAVKAISDLQKEQTKMDAELRAALRKSKQYTECKHTPEALLLLNKSLRGSK